MNIKSFVSPYFLLIFSAILISTLLDQFVQKQIENIISSKDGLTNMIWVWGAFSLVTAVFFPLIISFLCAFFLVSNQQQKLSRFFWTHFELGVIETLRAWGKTFLWSFVFIFPGIIKYINYFMTPFVVLFSERYQKGEVDALEYSTEISKKFWWSLKLWMGVFYVIVPVALYILLDEYQTFELHPLSATAVVLLESLIVILFHYIILKMFIKYLNQKEVQHGTHV